MKIGKIIRPVWSTQKSPRLEGVRLLEAQILGNGREQEQDATDKTVIVCDNLGAGIGEQVLLTEGSAVRDVVFSPDAPFKLVVSAIIDQVYLDSRQTNNNKLFSILRKEVK